MSAIDVSTPEYASPNPQEFSPLFGVVRHIVSFLKWRFSMLPQGSFRYDLVADGTPEQKNSEIYIGADTPYRPESMGKKPAITVARAPAAFAGLGLGDIAFTDMATGGHSRMDMLPTTLMVNCLSSEQVEAEGLAWFVANQISAFRDEIVKASDGTLLYIGPRAGFSPPSPAGTLISSPEMEWTAVVVSFPTYLQSIIHTEPRNQKILGGIRITGKNIDVKVK